MRVPPSRSAARRVVVRATSPGSARPPPVILFHSGNLVPNMGRPLRDSASVASSCRIPAFREHVVDHSDNVGGDPISGPSSSRKPATDDQVIVFGSDQAQLILQGSQPEPSSSLSVSVAISAFFRFDR